MINRSTTECSMRMTRHVLFIALISLPSLYGAERAEARPLVPHRAVYDLNLSAVSDTSDIESLTGRWVFDFKGSACEGYTAESRLVMRFETVDGPRLLDRRVTSFEAADGNTLKFESQSYADQELEEEVEGTAHRDAEGITVEYGKPDQAEVKFGPAVFPTAQVFEVLKKAKAGVRFYESHVFDGTEMVDDATAVSVVLGKPKPLKGPAGKLDVLGPLADDDFLPVTMAYFEPGAAREGEHVSDYDVSFKMHESGVQSDLVIRYEEYSMAANLVELSLRDRDAACTKEN